MTKQSQENTDKGQHCDVQANVHAGTQLTDALLLRTIMDSSQDTIYFKDIESRFLLNSRAHARQFAVDDAKGLVGKSDADFFPEEFAKKAREDELRIIKTGQPIVGRIEKWQKSENEVVWFSASKYPLYNEHGEIVGIWGTSKDITDMKRAEQELARVNTALEKANQMLKEISVVDELSGLFNRRYFNELLLDFTRQYALRRERGLPADFSLIVLDIDNFKHINDTYGHLVGDRAIRHVADIINANIRACDTAFRYGGDEYAVLLQDMELEGARNLAERIRRAVESAPLIFDKQQIKLTISLGVSCFGVAKGDREIVQQADAKLYQAKDAGRNKVQ